MPELPEVETIKRQLEKKLVGLEISDLEVRLKKQFVGKTEEVVGKKIIGVNRKGKMLIIELSGGKSLLIHLKLTGQLVYAPHQSVQGEQVIFPQGIPFAGTTLPAKTTHIIFTLSDRSRLFFNDNRQFGWIRIVQSAKLKVQNYLKLGIEPFTKEFTLENFQKVLSTWGRPIKILLMEQPKIAGVGNIYANEALFLARIAPQRRARDLKIEEVKRLYNSVIKVLEEGIKYKGSSGKDESYINAFGESGGYQKHFRVYQQSGKACPNKCGGMIRRMELSGRGTFFCPRCQK